MDFNPVMWALCKQSGGGSGGGSSDEGWIGDGNTHIWISLAEGRTSPMLGVGVNGTVTVDWGDGSAPDTLTGTSTRSVKRTPNHAYAKAGDYVITLSGGDIGIWGDSSGAYLLSASSSYSSSNKVNNAYRIAIQKIECGSNVMSINQYSFSNCYALTNITIPNSVTNIGGYAFDGCYSLTNVTISDGVTDISDRAFSNCYALTNITIYGSVTNIGAGAFNNCMSAACFNFTNHTSVPALAATNVFQNVPSDCIFKIPASIYDEWVAATNWSAVAGTYTFVGV